MNWFYWLYFGTLSSTPRFSILKTTKGDGSLWWCLRHRDIRQSRVIYSLAGMWNFATEIAKWNTPYGVLWFGDCSFMTSNARRYETSHKRNDFVNIKTTVGTSIARPLLLLQYLYNNYQIWYNSIELRLRGVAITVGGLPFFFWEGVCFCPLSFLQRRAIWCT